MKEIELVNIPKPYRSGNAIITVFTGSYKECYSFEKVTYNIKYDDGTWPGDGCLKFLLRDYYNHFYYFSANTGKFTYDIPDKPLDSVEVYYYKLNRKNPLVVGFKSVCKVTTYFSYDELRDSNVSSIIGDSFSASDLLNLLISLNSIINSKIRFFQSEGTKTAIKSIFEFVGPFKAIIYIPELTYGISNHRMFSNDLFDKYKSFNKIDSGLLTKLTSKEFNSIHVYYTYDRRIALMVDFVDDCRKYQFSRVSEDSWHFESFDGIETDNQLIVKLSGVYKNLKFNFNSPISHGHVLLDIMDLNGVEVTRLKPFNYNGTYFGLLFGVTFFFSFLLVYFLLTNYEFFTAYFRG